MGEPKNELKKKKNKTVVLLLSDRNGPDKRLKRSWRLLAAGVQLDAVGDPSLWGGDSRQGLRRRSVGSEFPLVRGDVAESEGGAGQLSGGGGDDDDGVSSLRSRRRRSSAALGSPSSSSDAAAASSSASEAAEVESAGWDEAEAPSAGPAAERTHGGERVRSCGLWEEV